MMKTSVLIVAGGSGNRFKDTTPKQFLIIKEKPLLMLLLKGFLIYMKYILYFLKTMFHYGKSCA
tara:strand:- start:796 stop:987 length:192 start_codon:yes stop_codon:yes gene_type:complete